MKSSTSFLRFLAGFFGLLSFLPGIAQTALTRELRSPDQNVAVSVSVGPTITYQVFYQNRLIVAPSEIDLVLQDGKKLSARYAKPRFTTRQNRGQIVSPVPEKRKVIPDVYQELTVDLRNSFSLIFRAYNDGVAYRIGTAFRDSITVKNETARFQFPENHRLYFPEVVKRPDQDRYHTSFEEVYSFKPLDSLSSRNLFFTPVLLAPTTAPKIAITESDLEEYPGMFLTGTGSKAVQGEWAPYPLEEAVAGGEYSQKYVTRRADFIAKTAGTRRFPWRVLIVAPNDKDLPGNDLVYRLASPSRVADVSWVKPGKATDEWIISSNLFNVPFRSGINTETYKFYIDFAKRFGFERIMMDAGWSDTQDLFKIRPEIDMNAIMAHARKQGIGVSMWTLGMTLERQLEPALEQFNRWGVDFIMTDFFDRDDQKTVRLFQKIAEACARHKLMLMFHGAYKPAGFNRTYPHAVAREAVLGSEFNIWSDKPSPDHNLLLPFIRMLSGPLDYEPGLLNNATPKTFRPIGENVMSMTTRCQQLAMFVVYESPIQFFSGNPSQGLTEPAFMELMGSIPTTWDTTRILDARVGDYLVTARQKNNDWFVGAMTDSTARDLTLPLDFLSEGTYEAAICEDGVNADRYAADYKLHTQTVTRTTTLPMHLAPGGGYVVRLRKK
ncbi:glycoside hydrolase family 97 protein [Larkinella terrae]|uniref:Glycoside hydrolase family 97 protein n=1 Tax=Larkinella terrae TaxID=2025311 RepID=A0A7K0ERV2_9BACT|nr:glycoside hydrolase family 97 protein [Larkinella terrae]MRS64537.1 glycoside hydrolase family 97 protein [Larkinella terrae]